MKTIELYGKGIVHTFQTLSKGKFLGYFLPALIMGLLLGYYYFKMQAYKEAATSTSSIPFIGGAISWTLGAFTGLIDGAVEFLFEFIVLVCFSPFNSMLSEKYDNYITGNQFDGGFIRVINDILRAIFIIIVAIFLQLAFMFGWWILVKIIPGLEPLTATVNFLTGAFFFGASLFDLTLERYGIGTFASWGYGFRRFLAMIIGGTLFSLMLKIPYAGIILAPGLLTMVTTYVYVYRENKVGEPHIVEEETEE